MKIIIIGAGVSGLTAAYILKNAGIDIEVHEAKKVPCGRMYGTQKNGFILDCGTQFFFNCYEHTYKLCSDLGIADQRNDFKLKAAIFRDKAFHPITFSLKPKDIWQSRKEFMFFKGVTQKGKIEMARALAIAFMKRKGLNFTDFETVLDLDDMTIADYCKRKGFNEILEYAFQPVIGCLALSTVEEMSTLYAYMLFWHMFNGLFSLEQGVHHLADELYNQCKGSVHLSSPVKRVILKNGKTKGVETKKGIVNADAVICTATATNALKIIPGLPDSLKIPLSRVNYSACCHVINGIRGNLVPEGMYALTFPRMNDFSISGITNSAIKSQQFAPQGCSLINYFTYGKYAKELNGMNDAAVYKKVFGDLRRVMPKASPDIIFKDIYRWDEAIYISSPKSTRNMYNLRKNNYNDVKGLFLAGDYLYTSSVEGAVKSGMDAAQRVMAIR